MPRIRPRDTLWKDLLEGALAGAVGTALMTPAQRALTRLQSPRDREWERQTSTTPATEVLARRASEAAGVHLPRTKEALAGQGVHFVYGMVWGAFHALVHRRRPGWMLGSGLMLGALLWLVGDEVLVPALHLSPPPEAFPASSHLKALGAHLAYGGATDGVFRLLHRALA
ncbi:MAG: DUF1440 domain-containing protein [Myxococcaceae bacterium]|nr:DUF1440 domain-containing protein [Myxococcaceae bacterium]MCI0672804.1 DUF1440 domain-containing protein [Myxococcaceae bacterium]